VSTPEQDWMTPEPWEVAAADHGEATRRGLARTPEERRAYRNRYHRDWNRARRYGSAEPIVGWLHELACDGNHKGHKGCKPVPCYRSDAEVAA
jgi:hypothetical protein